MMSRIDMAASILAGTLALTTCALFGYLPLLKTLWIIPEFAAALRRVSLTGEKALSSPRRALAIGGMA